MATADRARRGRWLLLGMPIVAAVVVGVLVLAGRGPSAPDDTASQPTDTTPAPVGVDATSSYDFATLEQMVDNTDLVVRGRVIATEGGPLVGEADASVVSRVVTLQVDDVLGGRLAASTTTDRGTI